MIKYLKWGTGKKVLVFLHGWPGDSTKWTELIGFLENGVTSYALDLPGWGETPLTKTHTLSDYADDVEAFLIKEQIKNPVLVGHSFGGRVAIKLVAAKPGVVKKMILIASAGIERKNWKVKVIKTFSPLIPENLRNFLRPLFGSKDYLQAEGIKRETFVNIISENLEPELPKIKTPTLIIWGENDHTTPLWMGKVMAAQIQGSTLSVIAGGDHGIPYRKAREVAETIVQFLDETIDNG